VITIKVYRTKKAGGRRVSCYKIKNGYDLVVRNGRIIVFGVKIYAGEERADAVFNALCVIYLE
jgi:hypothetical protein